MGDFFTKDQKNSWNEYVNEDVDVIEEPIVECPSGFQKNSEGECVEIVKIDDIESEVSSIKQPTKEISNSKKRSWESLDPMEQALYSTPADTEKMKKQVLEFDKTYVPSKDLPFEIGFKEKGEESELVKDKSSKLYDYLIKNNTQLQEKFIPETIQIILPEVKIERDKIFKKYDLSTTNGAIKAQEEFETYFNKKLEGELSKSSEYLSIMNDIKNTTGQAAVSQFRGLQRQALGYKPGEKDLGAFANIGENLTQFFSNINQSFQNTLSAVKGEANTKVKDKLQTIQKRLESGEIKLGDDVTQVMGEGTRNATIQTKTAQEWVDEYTNVVQNTEESLNKTLDYINKLEWKSQWRKANEFLDEDGMTPNDLVGAITQNVLQIPLAMLTYGVSAAIQEGGAGYRANLKAIARKEFDIPEGEEPTNDQLIRIMNERKDQVALATLQGIAGGALEYIGVKKSVAALLLGRKAFGSLIRGVMGNKGEFLKAGKGLVQTGLSAGQAGFFESITETGQSIIGQAGETYVGDKNVFNTKEIGESALQGLAVGFALPIGAAAVRQGRLEYRTTVAKISAKYGSDRNSEVFFKQMEDVINAADWMTQEEKRERLNEIGDARNAHNSLPKGMTNTKDKEEAILALMEIQALQKQYKGVAKELIPAAVKAQLLKRKLELTQLAFRNDLIKVSKEDTALMEAFANSVDGLNSKTYETTKEAQAAWNLMVDEKAAAGLIEELEGLNEKDRAGAIMLIKKGFTNVNGNILMLKDGSQEIILDNESKTDPDGTVKNALAANHELLHAVLTKVIGNNPEVFEKLYGELDKYLVEQVKAGKMSSKVYNRINARFNKQYKGRKQFDEFMTLISEEMQMFKYTGEGIDISDGILKNIINIITKAFRTLTGQPLPSSIKFKTGKDVFNFIKSYNKVYNKGGKARSAFIEEINAIKEEERLGTQQDIVPESFDKRFKKPTRKQRIKAQASKQSLYEETDNILKEYGKTDTAGLLIGLEWENEIRSRLKKGIRIPGTRDLVNFYTLENNKGERIVTDEMINDIVKSFSQGNRGIKGLVNTYDENKNDSLPAYINTFFNERILEYIPDDLLIAAQRVDDLLIEPIDESVTLGENTDKVRPMKSFSDFNIVEAEVIKQAKQEIIATIQELYVNEQNLTPERILEVVQVLIETKARNIVKASIGTISQVDGKTVISPEYLSFIEQSYKGAIAAYSLETIKRKFTRSTPKLFEVTRIPGKKGKEKVKKVNPDTGKTTYFVKGIFRIKAPSLAAWISFHTSSKFNYTTLRERQNSYATEITAEIAQQAIEEFASDPKNLTKLTPDNNLNATVGVKTVLDGIANEIDKKSNEQKSFDSFRSSTRELRSLPIDAQIIVSAALRSKAAIEYVADSEGSMLNVIQRLFSDTNILSPKRIELIALELQEIYDSVITPVKPKPFKTGYELNQFLAERLESKSEVTTYKDMFTAFGYTDVNFNYDDKDDIKKARQLLGVIAKEVGRDLFQLYYAAGFTAPSKISKGQWIPDGQGVKKNPLYVKGKGIKKEGVKNQYVWRYGTRKKDTVEAKTKEEALKLANKKLKEEKIKKKLKLEDISQVYRSNDQRYGVIESVEDLEKNILKGVPKKGEEGYISMPEGLEYSNPGITLSGKKSKKLKGQQKFSDWFFKPPAKGTMYTKAQQAAIIEAGKKSKLAYDYLIKKLKTLGPAGNGTITPDSMLFLFKAMNAQTNAITRTAAELGFLPDGEFNETMVLEHIIQAVTMNVIALDHVLAPVASDAFDLTLKDYKTTYLPESYDNMINQYYKQNMPHYWKPGMTGMVRYYNIETAGEFMLNMIDLETGKIYGEDFAGTINYKKSPAYIKGKATVIERFNEAVATYLGGNATANLGPEATKAAIEATKIRLNNAIEFAKEFDTTLKFNKEVLESSLVFKSTRSSIRESRKGISVWDFDDTLAITKSSVLYELPSGITGKLSATEFAKRSGELESQGAVFDFSEFNEITKGKKGPMFQKAVNRNKKFGNKNVFILTARPNVAAKPIHDFLKALGLDIPLQNIVGLEDGLPSAKAKWIVDKAAEGYNDFYFADDAYKNVKAVQDALSVLDVKSKSRQAKISFRSSSASKEIVGVEKIRIKRREIREKTWIADLDGKLGPEGYKEMLAKEKVLEDQIKRVEELEMNAYAEELRAEIKKIENQPLEDFVSDKSQRHLEDLKLALEQKFAPAWLADAVKTAGMDIKTGETFRSSQSSKNQELSTINGTIKEARRLDAIVSQYRKDYFEENYPYKSSVRETMSDQFNQIIEETTNVGAEKVYSRARARSEGGKKGWSFIMDPTAEDFKGLIYSFIGKGKQGERQLKFFNDTLFRPFAQGVSSIDKARQALSNDYRALLQQYPNIKKILSEDSGYGNFTIDHAVRVYLFNKAGFEIPGLSKRDLAALNKIVESNPVLLAFAQDLSRVTKQEKGYIEPGELWLAGNIASDLEDVTKRIGRKQYLETWIKNKNEIFSEDNLNKIEALYGTDFRNSLVEILHRMETGTNRSFSDSKNKIADTWMNWVNNSVGAIMFVNVRSAVLQTISMFNFINFSDNNIYAAAKAFGNQNQFWEDFTFLFNSDFLKQRRSGLQQDLNAAELTTYLAHQKNKAKALLNYLLKKGFLPTQIADSFAIASGGATFYRNRINTLMKQGMTKAEAEAEAMLQWRELSEEAQQSSRPDKISSQQAGPLGRFILAFANTPMQYTRLQKRAIQDLLNGRGDWKENVNKILYYGFVQNLIFNALQQALFAMLFDDDDELDPKGGRVINGMADSLLRGLGIYGAAVSAGKNMILEFIRQSKKSRPDYQSAALQSLSISPPLSSKINKLRSASKTWQYNKDDIMREGLSLDNPAYIAVGKVVSAFTNLPLDRLFIKIDNLRTATEEETEFWQSIALVLGWDQWGLGLNPYTSSSSTGRSSRKGTGRSSRTGRTRK